MKKSSSLYQSFLLRIWRDDERTPWRVQLEDPHSGEQHGFSTMRKMFEFLEQQMGETGDGNDEEA